MPDPKFKSGEPLSAWTAAEYNAVVARIEAWRRLTGAWPIVVDGGQAGQPKRVRIDHTHGFYARLSGSSSPYSFTEESGDAGGGWTSRSGARTGTANAYEVNSAASLNGKVVWVEPGWPGDYRFQWVGGGGGSGPITGGPLLGCYCPTPPAVLTMTVSGTCSPDLVHACTIEWQATPSWASTFGTNAYISNQSFFDSGGFEYYYVLTCFATQMFLRRIYPDLGGSPFDAGAVYTWSLVYPGNTCSPYLLSNGGPAPGISSCTATLSE